MDYDTDLGGPAAGFPLTHASLVRATTDPDPRLRRQALEALVAVYWKPVYKYLRVKEKLTNEDAKDLTQGFFTQALEKGFFERFDPARARFRTYVRVCVDGFVAKKQQAARRLKRGGQVEFVALDFAAADGELGRQPFPAGMDLDDYFRQEWIRGLFALAVEDLRRQCEAAGKAIHFALFERYDLAEPEAAAGLTYAQLGEEFGLPATQVTNYLAFARRRFRALVLERLRATTGSDEEFRQESQRLFGADFQ